MYSEKKDTREGLSGECLTKSALSFDDSTKRKSLPFDVNLSSFSDHTIQDFDDFDFVGLDYGAGMLPNLKYEFNDGLLSSCGDEPIILSTTNCRDQHDAALLPFVNMDTYIHMPSPQPIGKIVQLESSEQKPLEPLGRGCWDSMELEQPGTLEELGLDPENEGIISDFLGFVRKNESCKKVGKAWTRFYMLYEPPGTHGWSFIASVANYLKFDLYDLDLTSLSSIRELQDLLFSTTNRSLIAIQDFDHCATKLPILENELTFSLLSVYVDDLKLTCGDERIIVFTTNHRNRLDAARLLPVNVDTYIQNTSPQPVALPNEGETVQIDSSEHKPLVDFDATSIRTYKSGLLVSNSEKKSTRGAGGGEIGGTIALSLSESAATKNIAQHVGQDQSGSVASDSENERTREQGDPEEINATITLRDIRRHYGRRNREDAATSLAISVATFKRKCREFGIKRWPHVRKRKVGRPPDQHGEGNTSTARETPSRYVQTGMEGELVGQNEVANVFQRDFMGGPIALNTESGLIMVSRPPDQHGERNTSTACRAPSRNVETGMEVEPVGQNQEANVFRRDFMYGPIALNTDGLTFPECSDAIAPSQPMATILDTIPHLNGGSSECAFQVKNQSTQFTANPYPNGLVDPHPQIALTQILGENMERLEDRRNLLAPRKEPLPEGHVFGSVNWTVRSCSDLALSQPMPTIPHTTGCSEYWRNSLALLEEHLLEENDYGSINLTAPSCFDPGPSQPMHTIPHTMPTIPQMMPLLAERQDMRSVRLKATYGNTTIKFPLPSGFSELKEEVSKRLEFEHGSFKLEYKDEEGDSVLIACDEDVRDYLRLLTSLGNQVVKLFVLDKVPNTTNFCDNCGCDNCRSLKCKRP